MKKTIYLTLFIFGMSIVNLEVFAQSYSNPGVQTPTSIRGGGPNRATRCSDWNAVPQDSQTNTSPDSSAGSFTCRTHNYYVGSEYNRNTSSNGITLCNGEDKAVGRNGTTTQIVCRRWDDGNPTVNTGNVAYSRNNIWTNQNGTVTFGADDVPVSSINGTVESGIQTTRYCWGSSCSLSNSTQGTAANSVVVNTQQNRVLRYRTWDRNGNASSIQSVTVKIDKTSPVVQQLDHTDGWINNTSQTVTFELTDTGGSNLSRYTLQRRVSNGNPSFSGGWSGWSDVSGHTNRSISGSSYNGSYTYTGSNHRAYEFRIRVWDSAGNSSSNTNSGERTKIDITAPTISDVTNNVPTNILANSSYRYEISVDNNNGSPINLVRYTREDNLNQSNHIQNDLTSSPWRFNWNVNNVDIDRSSGGYRTYSHRLLRICDEAGNCWNGSQYKYHNIYANTLATNINSSVSSNELSSPIFADGTEKNIEIRLQDQYGNAIVPASGIGRNIDFNISANNRLHLDQYRNSGTDSALFVGNESNAISIGGSTNTSLDGRSSSDGTYAIPFYVYAPTLNRDTRVLGAASINGVRFDIDATIQVETGDRPQNIGVTGYTNTTIRANPLYSTVIGGSLADQGFIEGAIQDLDIDVIDTGVTTYNNSLRAEFGDVNGSDVNTANARYRFTINATEIAEGPQSSWTNTTQIRSSLTDLNNAATFMLQDTSVNSETFSYLASIIKYDVRTGSARKTVVYPSDVYGKDAYIGPAGENNSYQEGVRILGNTSSSNSQELTENQFSADIRIIGQVTKSTLRRDIEKNVYEVIKNIKDSELENGSGNVGQLGGTNGWIDLNNDGKRIYGNRVLYFKGQDVEIAQDTITGNKTLLVENGDVYISGDITGAGVLGIVVLNGNILINNQVTDIHAILYTNKSILSTTNGSDILDGSDSAEILENQLYIKGSIFSENTIGGSRKSIPECPYNAELSCNNQSEAQAYDLNYLRRYYIYDASVPRDGIPETPSGDQSTTAPSGNEQYPVIIDYNPAIQTTPPPFF